MEDVAFGVDAVEVEPLECFAAVGAEACGDVFDLGAEDRAGVEVCAAGEDLAVDGPVFGFAAGHVPGSDG